LVPGRYRIYVHGDCDWVGEPWASQWYDRADSLAAAIAHRSDRGPHDVCFGNPRGRRKDRRPNLERAGRARTALTSKSIAAGRPFAITLQRRPTAPSPFAA
jgi:hypothetical protein